MAKRLMKLAFAIFAVGSCDRGAQADDDMEDVMKEIHDHKAAMPQADLGICCLENVKGELTIDYLSAATVSGKLDPNSKCALTTVIPEDACSLRDQGHSQSPLRQGDEKLSVWPTKSATGGDCDVKCRADMERYAEYHNYLINQAELWKARNDQVRQQQLTKAENDHNVEVLQIHKTYSAAILKTAKDTGKTAKEVLTTLDKETADATNNLKQTETVKISALSNSIKVNVHGLENEAAAAGFKVGDPEGGDASAERINTLGDTTVQEVKSEINMGSDNFIPPLNDIQTSLTGKVQTEKTELTNKIEELDEEHKKANDERKQATDTAGATLKSSKEAIAKAEQEDTKKLDALKTAKDRQAHEATPEEPKCLKGNCCCTIKFKNKQGVVSAVDAKVSKKFIKWDVCQYAETVPTNFVGMSKCSGGFATHCDECAKRAKCVKVGNCQQVAEELDSLMYP